MLNPATSLALSTTRLECTVAGNLSVGTGYHYLFTVNGETVPAIVTNKHVIQGATQVRFDLQIMPTGYEDRVQADGSVEGEIRRPVVFDAANLTVIHHPDANIDLCAILIGPVVHQLPAGYALKSFALNRHLHITPDEIQHIRSVEPILMLGYPNGLWDEANNRPLARQGLTASHALLNWNGTRQFVIDAACFPGSSGSPVFLYEDGMYRTGGNNYSPGTRAMLLGTLWGGPTYTTEGRLVPEAIPTSLNVPVVPVMMNLGYVIHASALDDLIDPIATLMRQLRQ
jgi:hypothetical protein